MIALWRGPAALAAPRAAALGAALARYERAPATLVRPGEDSLIGGGPRESVAVHHGVHVALQGWIDNADDLAGQLGLSAPAPAALYAAALLRWGEAAEARLVGSYAAIAVLPGGTLHLARTPWDAPPLYYHAARGLVAASPLFRVLFALGAPRRPDFERMADELAYDWHSGAETTPWHGIAVVPLGGTVRIAADGTARSRVWHAPPAVAAERSYDEAAAAGRAGELLDEAAVKALAWADKPALSLSGGLDSPLVASALLTALPEPGRLAAITFRPDRAWDGRSPPGTIGDERPLVEALAAALPRLDCHFTARDIPPYDWRAREMYAAMEVLVPGLANTAMLHLVYAEARALGCDALLTADFGNATLSNAGTAGYVAYARGGHWRQLAALLRARPDDDRPLWRRALTLSLLPQGPAWLRRLARRAAHPDRGDLPALLTCLSPAALAAQRARSAARGSAGAWDDAGYDRDRAATVQREWREADGRGHDCALGFEQLYGVRRRDVTAYRPLVEFCMALPNRAFAWHGESRRLARVMARRRLPPAIADNPLHGQHNVDWHARLTRERGALAEALAAARAEPWLAATLDLPRLERLLADWPAAARFTWEDDLPRQLALPRALLAARFVGHLRGGNAL